MKFRHNENAFVQNHLKKKKKATLQKHSITEQFDYLGISNTGASPTCLEILQTFLFLCGDFQQTSNVVSNRSYNSTLITAAGWIYFCFVFL